MGGWGGGAGRIAICDKAKYWCVSGMSALQSQGSVFGGVGVGGLVTAPQCVGVGEGGGIVICAKAVYWCASVSVLSWVGGEGFTPGMMSDRTFTDVPHEVENGRK